MLEKNRYTKEEVTQQLGVRAYILALWEKQFGIRTDSQDGTVLYSAEDLRKLQSVKELLYEKGYSIDAAKQYLHSHPLISEHTVVPASPLLFKPQLTNKADSQLISQLLQLKKQLEKLRTLL